MKRTEKEDDAYHPLTGSYEIKVCVCARVKKAFFLKKIDFRPLDVKKAFSEWKNVFIKKFRLWRTSLGGLGVKKDIS